MSKNMGIIAGSTALAAVGAVGYYLNGRITSINSDLEKVLKHSKIMIKQVDTVGVNNKRIVDLVNILDHMKNVISLQQHRIAFLTDAVIDIQKGMYQKLSHNPKLIPREFILTPSMLNKNQKIQTSEQTYQKTKNSISQIDDL